MAMDANNLLRTLAAGNVHVQIPAFVGGRVISPEQRAGLVPIPEYFVFGASGIGSNMQSLHVAPPTLNPPPVYPAYVPPVPPGLLPQWQV